MKKTLLFIFSLLTLSLLGQDGINYQGAATDANGDELTNQSISIRASVLSGSASGNLEWEETHTTTTDQFGLFNIVIGQGTNTTNGATASFDDMDWGSGNHFLKIEMDATGGTNYAMIGTTQMMSVPYALYAKSAGIDSAAIAAMIGSSSGGMGGGCDFLFPEGLDGEPVTLNNLSSSPYTVPLGKVLHITSLYNVSNVGHFYINGIVVHKGYNNSQGSEDIVQSNNLILKSGDVLSALSNSGMSVNGFLVNGNINAITINDIYANPFIVPSGKIMIINSIYNPMQSDEVLINGIAIMQGYANSNSANNRSGTGPWFLKSGDVLTNCCTQPISINGYLVDENYFANCGGGGASSSVASNLDSAMVAGMIANAGGGNINPYHPEGLDGIEYVSNVTPYTVPSGKTFYMYTTLTNLEINGVNDVVSDDHYFPIPIAENSTLDWSGGTTQLKGYLVDKGYEVINYLGGSVNYTVPSNSYLYILNVSGYGLTVNSNVMLTSSMGGSNLTPPYILQPSDVVYSAKGFNGILIPLESEGGGGSSSASSGASNNNTVDSIIKTDLSCYVTYVGGTNPQPGFSSSDTLSVDYQEGRSLVISGDFHAPSGMSQVSLQITDDSFSTIPSHKYKVNGFHSKGGSYGGNPLTDMYHSITQASSFYPNSLFFEPNSYFSLDIDFFNLNTTKIHIYIIVDHAGGSSSGNGNINIQY